MPKKKVTRKTNITPIVIGIKRSKARYALSGKRPNSRPLAKRAK